MRQSPTGIRRASHGGGLQTACAFILRLRTNGALRHRPAGTLLALQAVGLESTHEQLTKLV